VSFGYRVNETRLELGHDEKPDSSFRLKWRKHDWNKPTRDPVRVDLGCSVRNLCFPVPDMQHGPSALAGAVKRVAADMPRFNKVKLRRLKRFTKRFCKKNFRDKQFKTDENFDFEEWMKDQSTYTLARKDELRNLRNEFNDDVNTTPSSRVGRVKSFIKDEHYGEFKFPRLINSRSDEYKTQVGPFFAKVGDILFESKYFIKKVPINDRPQWLMDTFSDKPNVSCTDWSQFEATFRKEIQQVEMIFYRYLLKNNPNKQRIIDLITTYQLGINRVEFKYFCFNIMARRMSGEMNTSSGNGFFNMVTNMFLMEEAGNQNYDGRYEGDDGIFWYDSVPLTVKDYAELGGKIKIETPPNLSEASFCGMVFCPEVLDNCCDPIEALVSFAWSRNKYLFSNLKTRMELLRSKSLSYLYQYPGCPIVRALALYGLRMTNNVTNEEAISRAYKTSSTYERDLLEEMRLHLDAKIMDKQVDPRSRELIQRKYKVTIAKQLEIEKYLNSLTHLQTLDIDVEDLIHVDAYTYSAMYVRPMSTERVHQDFSYFCVPTAKRTKCYSRPGVVFFE
jgi:hypothetical protein